MTASAPSPAPTRDLTNHFKVGGWLFILDGILACLGACSAIAVFMGSAALANDPTGSPILALVGTGVFLFVLVFAVLYLVAGYGLLKRPSWGRPVAIAAAIVSLFNFPLGTALGAYVLWATLQHDARAYFGATSASTALAPLPEPPAPAPAPAPTGAESIAPWDPAPPAEPMAPSEPPSGDPPAWN